MSKLKPCPFCGDKDVCLSSHITDICWFVRCIACGAAGPIAPVEDEAIAIWNTRKVQP